MDKKIRTQRIKPGTMGEAMEILDRMLRDYTADERRDIFSEGEYHFGIGMWIRNSWFYGRKDVCTPQKAPDVFTDGFMLADGFSDAVREAYLMHLGEC